MKDQLKKLIQKNLWDIDECICLQELEVGQEHLKLLPIQTILQSTQVLVHARISVRRGHGLDTAVRETYGLSGTNLSRWSDRQRLLANKLRLLLGTAGSTEYAQTWKRRGTRSGRVYWEHTASRRPTSGNDCIGWPSPRSHGSTTYDEITQQQALNRIAKTGYHSNLEEAVAMVEVSPWATPRTQTGGAESGQRKKELGRLESGGGDLQAMVQTVGWPSPAARDWRSESGGARTQEHQQVHTPQLNYQVLTCGWTTPQYADGRGRTGPNSKNADLIREASGVTLSQSDAATEKAGGSLKLNPAFSMWLMGYPIEWVIAGIRCALNKKKRSGAH